ncbi:MAG: CRTAC1 family protein [Phycisphaerales bacterium]
MKAMWLTAVSCSTSAALGQIAFSPVDAGHLTSDHKSGGGVSMLDVDGDGNLDILVTAGYDVSKKPERQISRLYWGDGKGRFALDESNDLTNAISYGSGSTWADFDNDGVLDVAISCQLGAGSVLARGLGGRRFQILETSPVHTDKGNSFSGVWADVDSDGKLDLLLCNNAYASPNVSFLYKGDGKGGFERVNNELAERKASTGGAYFGDFDGDGKPDVCMPNNTGKAALFRNLGNWKFAPVTVSALELAPFPVSGSSWVDYDNDGRLDLSLACAQGGTTMLLHNQAGSFEPAALGDASLISTNAGLLQWGDFDNDGNIDCIVPNWGAGSLLFLNKGRGNFTRVPVPGLTDQVLFASSCALADYDNDGRLDILIGQWPLRPGDGELVKLFHNDTPSTLHWLKIKLRGTTSNRCGIGARVTVQSAIRGEQTRQMREVSAGSGFRSQGDLAQHFGMGDATTASVIEVRWPSGTVQIVRDQPVDRVLEIVESN